jgi:glycosyltransferase involved in cell wall biosynthesis
MNRFLSVIIPTFRRRDSLAGLLDTLLHQKDVLLEIIVVDQNDGAYLNDIIPVLPNIKHLKLDQPNASSARNKGFLNSSGEYILFIDDDLLPAGDFCARGVDIFENYADIGAFSPLVYNAEGKENALQQAFLKRLEWFKGNGQIFSITDTISAAIFFRRNYFSLTGGFDPMLFEFARTAEDQEFFLRMRKKNMILYYVPFIEIFHDETVPGGCDLRSVDYWISREKCIRSWAYRYRIHHNPPGRLFFWDMVNLSRSVFLNREVLFSGTESIKKQIGLMTKAIKASDFFLRPRLKNYLPANSMNHLH